MRIHAGTLIAMALMGSAAASTIAAPPIATPRPFTVSVPHADQGKGPKAARKAARPRWRQ